MKQIRIEVPDDVRIEDMIYRNGVITCVNFVRTKPHKHAESMARFQKDVEDHGEAWAIDHWQFKSNQDEKWTDCDYPPKWVDWLNYRRVIKIGNRKVSEPIAELERGKVYYYTDFFSVNSFTFGGENQQTDRKVLRLTNEDAQELHEALLAVLAGE